MGRFSAISLIKLCQSDCIRLCKFLGLLEVYFHLLDFLRESLSKYVRRLLYQWILDC